MICIKTSSPHHILSLCERHHAPVSRSAAVRVDCGADSMAGTGAFCSGQAFCRRPHLTDADHIRVLTKDPLQQEVLVDVQGRIFAGPGEQMDYGIQNVSIFVPLNQIKFAAALLNRDEASVVRDLGQQPCHDGSFAGAGGPRQCRRIRHSGCRRSENEAFPLLHCRSPTASVQKPFVDLRYGWKR